MQKKSNDIYFIIFKFKFLSIFQAISISFALGFNLLNFSQSLHLFFSKFHYQPSLTKRLSNNNICKDPCVLIKLKEKNKRRLRRRKIKLYCCFNRNTILCLYFLLRNLHYIEKCCLENKRPLIQTTIYHLISQRTREKFYIACIYLMWTDPYYKQTQD